MNLPSEIPELLKFIQNKYGYTLHEIANKVSVTEAAISRWNNKKSFPRANKLNELKRLAEGNFETINKHPPPDEIAALKLEIASCKEKLNKLDGFIEGLKAAGFFSQAEHSTGRGVHSVPKEK